MYIIFIFTFLVVLIGLLFLWSVLYLALTYLFMATYWADREKVTTETTLPQQLSLIYNEWCVAVANGLRRIFYFITGYAPQPMLKMHTPIIFLIHGFVDSPLTFGALQKVLTAAGISNHRAIALRPIYGSIETIADGLMHDINQCCQRFQPPHVHIVAHSMGGLVVAQLMSVLRDTSWVKSVTSIATPWQGTKTAILSHGENCRQMRCDAEFLAKLNPLTEYPTISSLAISSTVDNLIVPWQSAKGEQRTSQQYIVENATHMQILHDTDVLNRVVEHIQTCDNASAATGKTHAKD